MKASIAVFLLSLAVPMALLGCTEEAPPPKMPAKVYVPWLVKKKPAAAPSTTAVSSATAPDESPDEPPDDASP